MEKNYLFLSDELIKSDFLTLLFGKKISFEKVTIPEYEVLYNENDRGYLISKKGHTISGILMELSKEQLLLMDMWKQVPRLKREKIYLESIKKEIYIYTSIDKNGKKEKPDISEKLQAFLSARKVNAEKYMDGYLMIPCSLQSIPNFSKNETPNDIGEYLIHKILENNKIEFRSDFVKCLQRKVIGQFSVYYQSDGKEYEEQCYATLTIHPETKLGIVILFFPTLVHPSSLLLNKFIMERLTIGQNQEKINLRTWLTNMGIEICGSLKFVMFSHGTLSKEEIKNILACEYAPEAKIIGKEFDAILENNIAQYDVVKAYVSECGLLEISYELEENLFLRIDTQAVEIFFLELIMLQDAAISRICEKIVKQLAKESKNPTRKDNIDILEKLACEMSQAILFVDFDSFIFPTVKISARKIAQSFGIDYLMEKYEKYKNILENLINIHTNRLEEIENDTTNQVLTILTITQVLPVLAQFFDIVYYERITLANVVSMISSVGACFMLFFVFHMVKKQRFKKRQRRKIGNK